MERECEESVVVAVVTEPRFTQRYRDYLEEQKLLDRLHRVAKLRDGAVALPVLAESLSEQNLQKLRSPLFFIKCMAKRGRVLPDGTRTPSVTLLLGDHGWVEHMDNGIRYKFDVTQCMFSFGNITEKLRVASLSCAGEVLVDLYAGIGYFTLPFLVHAGAAFVHACEWNPHAVVALRNNLEINGVADRCQIHFGDNRKLKLSDIADRVNLGLIPSSKEGWPVACQVLRKDVGGILHIHQNVESFSGKTPQPPGSNNVEKEHWPRPQKITTDTQGNGTTENFRGEISSANKPEWWRWAESAETQIASLLHHIVLDLECRPLTSSWPEGVDLLTQ